MRTTDHFKKKAILMLLGVQILLMFFINASTSYGAYGWAEWAETLNWNFESPMTNSTIPRWDAAGEYDVINSLGDLSPWSGSNMLFLSNGGNALGDYYSTATGTQAIVVPSDAKYVSFKFNFLSNEYPQYVGTKFDDKFSVKILVEKADGTWKVDNKYSTKSIKTAKWFDSDSGYNGEVGWQEKFIDIKKYRGKKIRLSFIVEDVGDTAFDSAVLIDNIVLNTKKKVAKQKAEPPSIFVTDGPDPSNPTKIVTIYNNTSGCTRYYQIIYDGAPDKVINTKSPKYSKPFTINQSATIKAISSKKDMISSNIAEASIVLPDPPELQHDSTISNIDGTKGTQLYYMFNVPPNTNYLVFNTKTSNIDGKWNLYASPWKKPTSKKYLKKNKGIKSNGKIQILDPVPGPWYILIEGAKGDFENVQLYGRHNWTYSDFFDYSWSTNSEDEAVLRISNPTSKGKYSYYNISGDEISHGYMLPMALGGDIATKGKKLHVIIESPDSFDDNALAPGVNIKTSMLNGKLYVTGSFDNDEPFWEQKRIKNKKLYKDDGYAQFVNEIHLTFDFKKLKKWKNEKDNLQLIVAIDHPTAKLYKKGIESLEILTTIYYLGTLPLIIL